MKLCLLLCSFEDIFSSRVFHSDTKLVPPSYLYSGAIIFWGGIRPLSISNSLQRFPALPNTLCMGSKHSYNQTVTKQSKTCSWQLWSPAPLFFYPPSSFCAIRDFLSPLIPKSKSFHGKVRKSPSFLNLYMKQLKLKLVDYAQIFLVTRDRKKEPFWLSRKRFAHRAQSNYAKQTLA